MGACGSAHRESGSALKLGMTFGSKPGKLSSIPPSPVKEKQATNGGRPINDQWSPARSTASAFRDYGSKEDAFFDTKPWLDSDCEDDFYSVNGDFTPSRGNTPVHHKFSHVNKTPIPVSIPAPSPIEKKKKLADLFRESFSDGDEADEAMDASGDQTMTNGKMGVKPTQDLPQKSRNGTPFSGSERTSNEDLSEGRPIKPTQCCLPTFVSFCSPSQRRKMSPTIAVAEKA
ncbi:uncharacterized protein At3g27210 isoform X2 [Argentina anserina]|uniref:uncharacterized protein At3g27210 isoform X2 n=1 Tax=Argentina anserina TaxID=57926 RepID=UPI00217685AF|nr:uncharacterized protein At3g27210 isoform X2 [Potentilla anserina]